MDFEGKVKPGHVIIHWNMDVSFETLPRQYDDWDVAKRNIAEWLGSGKTVSWEITTLWKRLPALHLLLDGKVTDELLVECPLITAGPDGEIIDPMLPDAASASVPGHYTRTIDLQALQRLLPEAEFFPADPGEGVLSFPVAGGTAVELEQDGSVYFRMWAPDHGLSREEPAGNIDPGLAPEYMVREFWTRISEATAKFLPPDPPEYEPPDEEVREVLQGPYTVTPDAQQPGWEHYSPEDLESDSFGPPDDPEAQACEVNPS